jgi:hypothetical protein
MESHATLCQTCDALLAAYSQSVKHFTKFVHGVLWEDAALATIQAQDLSQACKNGSDAVMAHWREDHNSLTQKSGLS